jgi:proline utilization trans-activator
LQCRKRRSGCSKDRPRCSRCRDNGLDCIYEENVKVLVTEKYALKKWLSEQVEDL